MNDADLEVIRPCPWKSASYYALLCYLSDGQQAICYFSSKCDCH